MYLLPQFLHGWSVKFADTEHKFREVLCGVWFGTRAGLLGQTADKIIRVNYGIFVGHGYGMGVLQ